MGSAAAPLGSLPRGDACSLAYRPRNPRATSLYQLLDALFETLKRLWEERFERRYGFWQAYWDSAVFSYLDCGLFESGFARVVCPECRFEFLVAFSCKGRGLCPSCGAKRAVLFSRLLQSKILADVPHAQWVLTLPKMLRPYFLYRRELLGELARLAYETVHQMMLAAVEEPEARPGMVAVIQTLGSSLKFHRHVHPLGSNHVTEMSWVSDLGAERPGEGGASGRQAGSAGNLMWWTSLRTVKETFVPRRTTAIPSWKGSRPMDPRPQPLLQRYSPVLH